MRVDAVIFVGWVEHGICAARLVEKLLATVADDVGFHAMPDAGCNKFAGVDFEIGIHFVRRFVDNVNGHSPFEQRV